MRAREMAPLLGSTAQYLPQVLAPFVAEGWLTSAPGPTGGYRMATDLEERTMLELIELSEGEVASDICVLKGGPCGQMDLCALHRPWQDARSALIERLGQIPISGREDEEREDV